MTKRAEETRIAIFTITGGLNYGQRLQNYALQETLKGFADEAHDVEVETVINTIWGESSMMSYYDRIEGGKVPACFAQWKREGFPVEEFSSWLGREISRQQVFEQFDRAYINRSPIMVSRENLERVGQELGDAYDWGVVGSDRVWNPGSVISGYEFAACMPPERRVSYAASFGKQTIPEKMRPWYRTYLSGLAHISVREEAGATIVRETAGREAVVVPDPVMLLPKEIWRLVMKRPEHIDTQAPYLLVYDLRMNDPKFAEHVRALAAQRDLALIVLPRYDVPFYNIGPAEFVYLIAHAAAVITDSFHGTCFSLQFGRPFLAVVEDCAMAQKMSSRFDTLLSSYGMEARRVARIEEATVERLFQDNLQDVPRRIRERRRVGTAFLEQAMSTVGSGKLRLNSVALMRHDCCTGCTACASACPQQAITMRPDCAGFLYPSVNPSKCTDCGRCLQTCPVCTPMTSTSQKLIVPEQAKEEEARTFPAYAVRAADDDVRMASSSGGVFPMLALQTLAKGGVVVGVTAGSATDGWHVHHVAVERAEDLAALFRSKYVQSDKCDTFRQVASYLRAGRDVLFSGTGCEVQGLVRALAAMHQDTTHLLTVDVVCHGVPSPALWGKYMQLRLMLDGQGTNDVLGVRFRDKRDGWQRWKTSCRSCFGEGDGHA